ncbi:uncharacterized protein LOC106643131 [Copidosoma floridanum]|uniref:uncharacterized protein LOC106643131 n=1 Tax=Copidosoma floridanum TaxID=29053 RepID=UPI000C6F94A0|nr:uncharacterized protein LOC106643131 [Copidosoma floridanum]
MLTLSSNESKMAPNAEEDLLVTIPRNNGPHSTKQRQRPPTYNAEDYAITLRRWGRRALGGKSLDTSNGQSTLPSSCTSLSSGYASTNPGEMTLRQFTSVTELLNKLRADLRLAFPSFVQEFASPPADGISLLLETLRSVQLSQSTPPSATGSSRRPRARRAALDELGCVECLAACTERCPDAARILAQVQPGLLALAVCLTSSLNRTRVLALQLLTRVCATSGGHAAVSEAVSTLRLRYGEGGRFRFLAGALLAPKAAPALRLAGVSFLNAFIGSAPRTQAKLYIQAETCEAGLEPRILQEWLRQPDPAADAYDEHDETGGRPLGELLREEVGKWSRHCVDVDALQLRARIAEESCRALTKKVAVLQRQLQILQLERMNEHNPRVDVDKKISSSAEDEGISFSERSSSPVDPKPRRATNNNQMDNDQETTIDDVIEELRIIVKDAEEELHDWNQLSSKNNAPRSGLFSEEAAPSTKGIKNGLPSKARVCLRNSEENARLDRDLKKTSLKILVPGAKIKNRDILDVDIEARNGHEDEDKESVIVPAIIHPQPPRRAAGSCQLLLSHRYQTADHHYPQDIDHHQGIMIEACVDSDPDEQDLLLMARDNVDDEDDDDIIDDGSDSLLSASRLDNNYHHCQQDGRRRHQSRRSLDTSATAELKLESLADFEISESVFDELRVAKRSSSHPRAAEPGNNNSVRPLHPRCSNTVQRRTERRKYLRRCQSQDHIREPRQADESTCSLKSLRGSGRVVLEQIRKFESLNGLEERDQQPVLRRSESFHQTRLSPTPQAGGEGRERHQRSMTKSLDRIDEARSSHAGKNVEKRRKLSASDERHKDDRRRKQRSVADDYAKRKYRVAEDAKYTSFFDGSGGKKQSSGRDYRQPSDPKIFANRAHDVLGFGKNRFNAGKYSGSSGAHHALQTPPQQFHASKLAPRHATSSSSTALNARNKVTDVVSGLY